jgi:hypothetical protein
MDEKKRHANDGDGARMTLGQLSDEVERMRKREGHFDAHTLWSGKELRAQREEVGRLEGRIRWSRRLAGLALVALIGAGWWGLDRIHEQQAALDSLPNPEAMVAKVDERVDAFADRLADLSAEGEVIQGFEDRIAALEASSETTIEALRAQVQTAARVEAEARLETARQLDDTVSRVEALETARDASGEQLAALEGGLREMRQDVAGDLALAELRTSDMVDSVEAQVAGNARGLEAVSWEVGRERLDFELFEDYRLEVAPGIVLNISDTDVAYQKVDGWIHLLSDGRFLRIHDHPIQQALVFYDLEEDRSYELVFTRVRPEAAIGYVRVPSDGGVRVVNQVRDPDFPDQVTGERQVWAGGQVSEVR